MMVILWVALGIAVGVWIAALINYIFAEREWRRTSKRYYGL